MPRKTPEEYLAEYRCFFCNGQADRIGYYMKWYVKPSKENPTLFCKSCWNNPIHRESINCMRGGKEGIFCITFEDLGKMTDEEIGYVMGKKNYEINHCANSRWRKIIHHIHYISKPPKEKKQAA